MLSRSRSILHLWFLLVLLTSAGCGGGKFGRVEGTVTLDGQPLPDVSVNFTPLNPIDGEAPGSSGITDSDGKYSLSLTVEQTAGALIGEHRVTISKNYESEDDVASPAELAKNALPFHDFSFEVKTGSNTADFNLETKKKGK